MPTSRLSKPDVLIRVAADTVLIQVSLLAAFGLRLLILAFLGADGPFEELAGFNSALWDSLSIFGSSGWVLTGICLITFYLSGFYSRTRAYRGRYKALVVFRAISLAYLISGFLSYFLTGLPPIPRSVIVGGYLMTLCSVGGGRFWVFTLRRIFPYQELALDNPPGIPNHILVIGGAGYIGSALCRLLLETDYQVRVLDLLLYGEESLFDIKDHPRFELIRGDVRNIETLVHSLRGAYAVVHLGEIVGDPACSHDEGITREVNYAASKMVAEAAKGAGVSRFVYASSCSVYGASNEILDEQSSLSPMSLYARAKIASESAIMMLKSEEFHPTIVRFGTVYGLSHRPRFDLVINLLTAKAICEGEITIYGGQQWRPFIHVQDAAAALLLCLESPLGLVGGQVFNTGSDEQNFKIDQIGEIIQSVVPGARITQHSEAGDQRNYHVSFKKIRQNLGFLPSLTVEEGVKELAVVLKEGNLGDYRQARYSNYKTISESHGQEALKRNRINSLYDDAAVELTSSS